MVAISESCGRLIPSPRYFNEAKGWFPEEPGCIFTNLSQSGRNFTEMSDRLVSGVRGIREFQVWPNYIEATFDDTQHTALGNLASPTILAASVVYLEKVAYVYMCYELGLTYDPYGPKEIELRSTKLEGRCTAMAQGETCTTLQTRVTSLRWFSDKKFRIRLFARMNNGIQVNFESCGFLAESARFVTIRKTGSRNFRRPQSSLGIRRRGNLLTAKVVPRATCFISTDCKAKRVGRR